MLCEPAVNPRLMERERGLLGSRVRRREGERERERDKDRDGDGDRDGERERERKKHTEGEALYRDVALYLAVPCRSGGWYVPQYVGPNPVPGTRGPEQHPSGRGKLRTLVPTKLAFWWLLSIDL